MSFHTSRNITSLLNTLHHPSSLSPIIGLPSLPPSQVLSGFTAPFDKNGVLFHIGTAGGTDIYQNPHLTGAVTASMSSIYKVRTWIRLTFSFLFFSVSVTLLAPPPYPSLLLFPFSLSRLISPIFLPPSPPPFSFYFLYLSTHSLLASPSIIPFPPLSPIPPPAVFPFRSYQPLPFVTLTTCKALNLNSSHALLLSILLTQPLHTALYHRVTCIMLWSRREVSCPTTRTTPRGPG